MVRLGTRSDEPAIADQTIQKLMSMAILDKNKQVLGVLQASRKGATRNTAGPDFTDVDLHTLLEARPVIAQHHAQVDRLSVTSLIALSPASPRFLL